MPTGKSRCGIPSQSDDEWVDRNGPRGTRLSHNFAVAPRGGDYSRAMTASQPPAIAEFTLKAVVVGIVLGIVFGAANVYLALKVGMTVSASIPAAVMAVAVFKLLRSRNTILEANLAQTIGSASTSLATGTVFTIPVLFMWGIAPPLWQIAILAFLGGVLGLAAMIPLRRLLIVREDATLPYPEGRACAEVLRATAGNASGSRWIFHGMLVGAAVKLLISLAFLMPGEAATLVFPSLLPQAELAIELSPSLLAVGFILGFRQSGVCVAGALISALVLTPLIAFFGSRLAVPVAPETTVLITDMDATAIWKTYVRYIGAGAVATAGILTVLRNLPSMVGAVRAVFVGVRGARGAEAVQDERTDRDLPGTFVIGAIAFVVLTAGFVPGIFAGDMPLEARLICAAGVAVFGILFVTVAARIVGIVGVSSQPTSGIALITLIGVASVFTAMGWNDASARAAVLTVGTIVAVAASKAGDISQDLKTGFLVGATPARQQFGQLIGAAFACWAVAGTVLLLGNNYVIGVDFKAPQATLMKTIIEGVLSGTLPWDLVLTGGGLSLGAILCGASGLAFSIGVYLGVASMAPLFIGGCVRALCDRARRGANDTDANPGVLAASGLVAGEGLAGILVASLVALGRVPKSAATVFEGQSGQWAVVATVLAICGFLYVAAKKG